MSSAVFRSCAVATALAVVLGLYGCGGEPAEPIEESIAPTAEPCCTSCAAPLAHYWALDTPNHECAETCLDPSSKVAMAAWWVLTGGKGQLATTPTPCRSAGFARFNRTDTIGAGKFNERLDKYLPGCASEA